MSTNRDPSLRLAECAPPWQVLGIHMFSMALQTLRSDFDLVLDIQRNSKRHLSQHRDSLKNATEVRARVCVCVCVLSFSLHFPFFKIP